MKRNFLIAALTFQLILGPVTVIGFAIGTQQIFTGKETVLNLKGQADLKRIAIGGALQLGRDMAPGEYVLQITVRDPLADAKHRVATQWIDFEVVK